jgi:hypothetical protein
MSTSNRPVQEIKLAQVRASIWANQNDRGETWYRVSICRSYRDHEGWKETTSFARDDLPIVAKAAELAYAWIWSQTAHSDQQGNRADVSR